MCKCELMALILCKTSFQAVPASNRTLSVSSQSPVTLTTLVEALISKNALTYHSSSATSAGTTGTARTARTSGGPRTASPKLTVALCTFALESGTNTAKMCPDGNNAFKLLERTRMSSLQYKCL